MCSNMQLSSLEVLSMFDIKLRRLLRIQQAKCQLESLFQNSTRLLLPCALTSYSSLLTR